MLETHRQTLFAQILICGYRFLIIPHTFPNNPFLNSMREFAVINRILRLPLMLPLPSWLILPILTFTIAVFSFPNAGLGNNGHCDPWYYWGMGHSSRISENVLALDYYPGSRVPLYSLGWLLNSTINPLLWSKLLMILTVLIPAGFILVFTKGKTRKLSFISYFLAQLTPIAFSQSSVTYAGFSYSWILVLALLTFVLETRRQSIYIIGFIIGLLFLANAEVLVILPPILVYLTIRFKLQSRTNFFWIIFGLFSSYVFFLFVLFFQGYPFKESLSYPKPQIIAITSALRTENFWGEFNGSWLTNTPLFVFHVATLIMLLVASKSKIDIWPKSFLWIFAGQLVFLVVLQLSSLTAIFQSGFHAILGFWPIVLIIYFVLLKETKESLLLSCVFIFFFIVFLMFSIRIVLISREITNFNESLFTSCILPTLAVFVFLLIRRINFVRPIGQGALLVLLIPFLSTHSLDYSGAFYTQENKVFAPKSPVVAGTYETAQYALNEFSALIIPPTAVIGIEDTSNQLQTSFIRAAVRSFSSCPFDWSRKNSISEITNHESLDFPRNVLLVSSMELSDVELKDSFGDITIREYKKSAIFEQAIYWYLFRIIK